MAKGKEDSRDSKARDSPREMEKGNTRVRANPYSMGIATHAAAEATASGIAQILERDSREIAIRAESGDTKEHNAQAKEGARVMAKVARKG